ncbi:MAG: divergent PAP2 family protein [Clostridia bacterium]|nr:divergent PAP2 family protein [Clostridia bacterium]
MKKYILLYTVIIAWFSVQVFKFLADAIIHRKFNFKRLVETGGMPSSHSAVVTSLMTLIALNYGIDSPYFVISFVFGIIVMYDAAGVRRAAGKQAGILNQLIYSNQVQVDTNEKLKELLGHTPFEVLVGAIWGIALAFLLNNF